MASNISVKDASAATVVMKTTESAGVHTTHVNVDNTVTVSGTVTVGSALPAGTNAIGKLAANAGVTIGAVEIVGKTTSDLTVYRNGDVDETGVNVKSTAGVLYSLIINNSASSARYVRLYDKATAPTVGTDTPFLGEFYCSRGTTVIEFVRGYPFSAGLGIGATTATGDSDTTAPGASEVFVNIAYK